jgi:hypothetical protein
MASSSAEREIRILERNTAPKVFHTQEIKGLGLAITFAYDEVNDALLLDFGLKEPTYDLPEPDGRIIWKIAHCSEMVAGVVVLGAKKWGVEKIGVSIKGRKEVIEEVLKKTPNAFYAGRPTQTLIEQVELKIKTKKTPKNSSCDISDVFDKFQKDFVGMNS